MTTSDQLARNLHYLTAHYRSVAEVCRRIGINRQQFNKYLNGSTLPSIHNFKRIADFFGVDEAELLLPHEEFVTIVMRRPIGMDVPEAMRRFFHESRQKLAESCRAFERYHGFYHAYFCSPAWPKGVLCSLYAISGDGQLTYVKSVERLAWREKAKPEYFVHKYQGLATLEENRLYLLEWQPRLRNIFSMTILYPSNRSRVTRLQGLVTSVTGGHSRKPFASRILFERLADQQDVRAALSTCGVYRIDSGALDPDILASIDNDTSGPGEVLTAADY